MVIYPVNKSRELNLICVVREKNMIQNIQLIDKVVIQNSKLENFLKVT